jgi:alpha-beta hydrolase superfamily lysophospholipase
MAPSAASDRIAATSPHRRVWSTPNRDARDVVLCLHGIESHSDWFEELASSLTTRGIDVVAFDRAGFGRSTGKAGDAESETALFAAIDAQCTTLKERYDRIHAVGLSWGGLLTAAALLDRPTRFATATLIAPALVTRRKLSPWALLMAFFSFVSNGLLKVALPIRPEDFTARADRVRYIEGDPHRTRAVTGRFLWLTLLLQLRVRRTWRTSALPPTLVCLAGVEPLIDNEAVRRLTQGATVVDWPGRHHSLVFEAPDELAAAIGELIARGGTP